MNILNLFAPVTKLIDEVVTSDEERLQLRNELEKIKADVDVEIVKVGGKVVDAEAKIRTADAKLREIELKSDSWLTRNWRPFMMMMLSIPLLFNYVAVPIMELASDKFWLINPIELDSNYWLIIQTFYGVYGGGRTLEKITKMIRK